MAHTHATPVLNATDEAARRARIATTASVSVAVVLIAMKAGAVYASGSASVLASLADSALDLLASLTTFYAVRFARKAPDREHPYGHGKAEAFSALFQACLVFASAALLVQEGLKRFNAPEPLSHAGWALAVMIVSTVLTVALLAVQGWALKANRSVAVQADRMHYLTDLAGNTVAVLGIAGAAIGFLFMDAVGGIAIALWLVWGAVGVIRQAADNLMDRALDDEEEAQILAAASADPAVLDVHRLRTRVSGPHIHIQMHMSVDPALSLIDAHTLLLEAEKRILAIFPNADILIHPDPQGVAEKHGGVFQETR